MQQRKRLNGQSSRMRPLMAAVVSVALVVAGAFGGNHIVQVQSAAPAQMDVYNASESFATGANITVDDAAVRTQGGETEERRVVKEFTRDREFTLFGLTWKGDRDIVAYVRAQRADGTWTEWFEMDPLDAAPGTDTFGTEPIFVEPTKRVQVSTGNVDLLENGRKDSTAPNTATDIQAVFIDGGTGTVNGNIKPVVDSYTYGMPKVITRAQWGAGKNSNPTYTAPVTAATVHHTAGSNNYTEAQAPGIVRGIWNYHTYTLGWGDVGYNAMVDKYGNIYEGRYGGLDRAVQGAHVGGFNQNTWGVSVLGNYQTAVPTQASLQALGDIIGWKAAVSGFDPMGSSYHYADFDFKGSKYRAGQGGMFPNINAHRDFHYNECPGQNLYNQMGTVRTIANTKYRALKNSSEFTPPGDYTGPVTDTTVGDLLDALGSGKKESDTVTNPDGTTTQVTNSGSSDNISLSGIASGDAVAIAAAVGTLAGLIFLYAKANDLLPGGIQNLAGVEIAPGLTLQQIAPYIEPMLKFAGQNDLAAVWKQFEPTLGAVIGGVGGVGGNDFGFFQNGIAVRNAKGEAFTMFTKIANAWLQQGLDAGPLGLPVNSEHPIGDGLFRVDFQGGDITYNQHTNTINIGVH